MPNIADIIEVAEELEDKAVVPASKRCVAVRNRNASCRKCIDACPADAIYVEGADNTEEERYSPGERYGRVYQINYLRCILCGMCQRVCPAGAITKHEATGLVTVDDSKCIGCQYCIYACPYGVRQFNEDAGVVQKCTLCAQITADGDGVPACVHNCNCGARFFGDYDDPESDVCRELAKYPEEAIHTLPDPNDAKPLTRYILSPKFASWKELV